MPYITVTAAPSAQAVASDPVTRLRFRLDQPVEVDADVVDAVLGRLKSLEGLGFKFEASAIPENAPSGAPTPTAEQAADPLAPPAPTP